MHTLVVVVDRSVGAPGSGNKWSLPDHRHAQSACLLKITLANGICILCILARVVLVVCML